MLRSENNLDLPLAYYILNYTCYVQHPSIYQYNGSDLFTLNFLLQMQQNFVLLYESCSLFVNDIFFFSSKLIIYIASSPKDLQNFFMQSSTLYT